jgi:Zn-dependent peptidase ImmA (M78 family)
MKIIIPKTVKVSGHTYSVDLRKTNDKEKRREYWGTTYLATKEILIDSETAKTQQENTFFHELLHACFHECGLDHDIDEKAQLTEEQIVNRLSKILYQVLADNTLFK